MTEIPRAQADTVKEAIAGFEKTSDVGEEVSEEDAADARDVSEGNAKRQKRFLADIGVLDKDGYDYTLTEDGNSIGEYIRFNQEEQASETLRRLFEENWESLDELLANINEEGMERGELVDKVAFVTATELTSNRREYGAKAIVDFLEWTGFIESDEDDVYYLVDEGVDNTTSTEVEDDTDDGTSEEVDDEVDSGEDTELTEETSVQKETSDSTNSADVNNDSMGVTLERGLNLNIDLELSGDENPENVRRLILAIRKAANQEVDEYDFPEQTE